MLTEDPTATALYGRPALTHTGKMAEAGDGLSAGPAEEKTDAMAVDAPASKAAAPAAGGDGVRFEIRKWNAVCM